MDKEISKRHRFQNNDNSISANGGNGKRAILKTLFTITLTYNQAPHIFRAPIFKLNGR